MNCVTEEMKDPVKTMPRAIIISMITITLIYILTNVAYFAVLSPDEIRGSDAIAVFFGEKIWLNDAAKWIMPITVAISAMGGLNGSIFAFSRVLFAGARQGQLFSALETIHLEHLTPIPAILITGFLASFCLITTKILALINYMVFVEAILSAMAVSTVFGLRYKLPNLKRPLRIYNVIPIIYLVFSAILIILPIYSSPVEASIGLLITLSGVPAYYLTANWLQKPDFYQRKLDQFNKITQMLTMSVTPSSDVSI